MCDTIAGSEVGYRNLKGKLMESGKKGQGDQR